MPAREKVTELRGSGYLLRGAEFVSPVDFRLRAGEIHDGGPAAEGELVPKRRRGVGRRGERFVLQTNAGYSLPVEITEPLAGGRIGFRRVAAGKD